MVKKWQLAVLHLDHLFEGKVSLSIPVEQRED